MERKPTKPIPLMINVQTGGREHLSRDTQDSTRDTRNQMQNGASFPITRAVLWNRNPIGRSQQITFSKARKIRMHLNEKALLLAAKHGNTNMKFLIGSFITESDGVLLQVDRFDPGRNIQIQTGDGFITRRVPTAVIPGDHIISVQFNRGLCKDATRSLTDNETMRQNTEILINRSCKKHPVNVSDLFISYANCNYQTDIDELIVDYSGTTLAFATDFEAKPINSVPIIPTALAKNLSSPLRLSHIQESPKFGYLTMDQTRKLLLLLETDPKVDTLPLVGIWISGVEDISHPYGWACCLKFLCAEYIQERVMAPPSCFLLLHYPTSKGFPDFYECQAKSDGKGNKKFDLLTCKEQLVINTSSKPSDSRSDVCMDLLKIDEKEEEFEIKMSVLDNHIRCYFTGKPCIRGTMALDHTQENEDAPAPRPSPVPFSMSSKPQPRTHSVPELSVIETHAANSSSKGYNPKDYQEQSISEKRDQEGAHSALRAESVLGKSEQTGYQDRPRGTITLSDKDIVAKSNQTEIEIHENASKDWKKDAVKKPRQFLPSKFQNDEIDDPLNLSDIDFAANAELQGLDYKENQGTNKPAPTDIKRQGTENNTEDVDNRADRGTPTTLRILSNSLKHGLNSSEQHLKPSNPKVTHESTKTELFESNYMSKDQENTDGDDISRRNNEIGIRSSERCSNRVATESHKALTVIAEHERQLLELREQIRVLLEMKQMEEMKSVQDLHRNVKSSVNTSVQCSMIASTPSRASVSVNTGESLLLNKDETKFDIQRCSCCEQCQRNRNQSSSRQRRQVETKTMPVTPDTDGVERASFVGDSYSLSDIKEADFQMESLSANRVSTSLQSFASDFQAVDLPVFDDSQNNEPNSPDDVELGASASMINQNDDQSPVIESYNQSGQNDCDKDAGNAMSPEEEFYQQMVANVKYLLDDQAEEKTERAFEPDDDSNSEEVTHDSDELHERESIAERTLRQLRLLGDDSQSSLGDSVAEKLKKAEQNVGTVLHPKINYVSFFGNDHGDESNVLADEIALRYLSSSQVRDVQFNVTQKTKSVKFEGIFNEIPRTPQGNMNLYSVNVSCNMSIATRKYMQRYNLLDSQPHFEDSKPCKRENLRVKGRKGTAMLGIAEDKENVEQLGNILDLGKLKALPKLA